MGSDAQGWNENNGTPWGQGDSLHRAALASDRPVAWGPCEKVEVVVSGTDPRRFRLFHGRVGGSVEKVAR